MFSYELYCTPCTLGARERALARFTCQYRLAIASTRGCMGWFVCAMPGASRQEEDQVLWFYSALPLAMGCA